jgi:hypothetical protein
MITRVPDGDVRRNHGAHAVAEDGRLVRRAGGLALHRRFGLDDLERHGARQFQGDRHVVVGRQDDGHVFLQIGAQVADHFLGGHELVVAFRVHEVIALAVLVQEGVVALVDEGALDGLGRAVAFRHLHPVRDAAHVQLGDRRALAGVDVFDVENDVELAVHIDDETLPQRAGGDFGHVVRPWIPRRPGAARICVGYRPPIAILAKFASPTRDFPVPTASPSPWWRPENHADRRPFLLARNRIKAAFRAWFEARDFLEVETAALQVSPGNEAHLHAFETTP